MLIERTSAFLDDPDILADYLKTIEAAKPDVKHFVVVPKEVFNLIDSVEVSGIEISTLEI